MNLKLKLHLPTPIWARKKTKKKSDSMSNNFARIYPEKSVRNLRRKFHNRMSLKKSNQLKARDLKGQSSPRKAEEEELTRAIMSQMRSVGRIFPPAENVSINYAPPRKFTRKFAQKSKTTSTAFSAGSATKITTTTFIVNSANKFTAQMERMRTMTSGSAVITVTDG